MRRPSSQITINPITITKATGWTKDAAGGRVPAYGSPGSTINASVQPSSSDDVPDHMREAGVTYYTVFVHDDPGVTVRDRVNYGAKLLTVHGVMNAAGRNRSWKILCEERPTS